MRLGDRIITGQWSADAPPCIIAEIGINHDGRLDQALRLIDAAAQAGVDAVKTQLFDAHLLMSRAGQLAPYQARAGESDPVAMLQSLQLTLDDLNTFVEHAHQCSLHAVITVFSLPLVEPASQQNWDAFKSASPDIIHHDLLAAMQSTGKPLIISTGAADEDEVLHALTRFGDAALHCVSSYPTPMAHAQLAGIRALIRTCAMIPRILRMNEAFSVGYSDHTTSEVSGALAVACGAAILEKHFTLDQSAQGPDHAASLNPDQMKRYVQLAHEAHASLGPERIMVQPIEEDVRTVSRQSIVTTHPLPAGHILSADDLTVKRPGTGLPPTSLKKVIGSRLLRSIESDQPITRNDVAFHS